MRNTLVRAGAAGTVIAMAIIVGLAIAAGRPGWEITVYAVILVILAGSTALALRGPGA